MFDWYTFKKHQLLRRKNRDLIKAIHLTNQILDFISKVVDSDDYNEQDKKEIINQLLQSTKR